MRLQTFCLPQGISIPADEIDTPRSDALHLCGSCTRILRDVDGVDRRACSLSHAADPQDSYQDPRDFYRQTLAWVLPVTTALNILLTIHTESSSTLSAVGRFLNHAEHDYILAAKIWSSITQNKRQVQQYPARFTLSLTLFVIGR